MPKTTPPATRNSVRAPLAMLFVLVAGALAWLGWMGEDRAPDTATIVAQRGSTPASDLPLDPAKPSVAEVDPLPKTAERPSRPPEDRSKRRETGSSANSTSGSGRRVWGFITDEEGNPLPDARGWIEFTLGDQGEARRTSFQTDDDGAYSRAIQAWPALSPHTPLRIRVDAYAPGHHPQWNLERTTTGGTKGIQVDLSLPAGRVLTGTVQRASGRPAERVHVELFATDSNKIGGSLLHARTDEAGNYRFALADYIPVRILAHSSDWGSADWDTDLRSPPIADIRAPLLRLQPRSSLSGRARCTDGTGAAGLQLIVEQLNPQPNISLRDKLYLGQRRITVTGPDGSFSCQGLDPGLYRLRLMASQHELGIFETGLAADFTLPHLLEVQVVDIAGRTLPGVYVDSWEVADGSRISRAPALGPGAIARLPHDGPGPYALRAFFAGEFFETEVQPTTTDPCRLFATFQLDPAARGALRLNLRTTSGAVVEDFTASVMSALSGENYGNFGPLDLSADGVYRELPPGVYNIRLLPDAGSYLIPATLGPVRLEHGTVTDLGYEPQIGGRIRLEVGIAGPPPSSVGNGIQAHLVSPDRSKKQSLAFFFANPPDDRYTRQIQPETAFLTSTLILPGDYLLLVQWAGYRSSETGVRIAGGATTDVAVVLERR